MSKATQLGLIQQSIIDDNVCPELRDGATQLVFGEGSPDAKIAFVGEAPGKSEDEQGKPFVGAAGKFLNEMLTNIDMKRDEVYITNIVKYRPPDNRDPLPEEKKSFLPYLQAQLEAIQPKIVATLGRHSMNCFLPDLRISQVHGQPKRIRLGFRELADSSLGKQLGKHSPSSQLLTPNYYEIVILPLFHPAAALYNGGMRQTLIDDFERIPEILRKIKD